MRQWMVDPKLMCQKHLLGEHVEMHMFVGTIARGVSIDGYIRDGLLNPGEIKSRHDALVVEMNRRGMNHKSPLDVNPVPGNQFEANIDAKAAMRELIRRCPECAELHREHYPDLVAEVFKGGDKIVSIAGSFYIQVNGIEYAKPYKNRQMADMGIEKTRRELRQRGEL